MVFQDPPVRFHVNWWEGSGERIQPVFREEGEHKKEQRKARAKVVCESCESDSPRCQVTFAEGTEIAGPVTTSKIRRMERLDWSQG